MPLKNDFSKIEEPKDESFSEDEVKVEKEDKEQNEEIQVDTLNALPEPVPDEQDLMLSRKRDGKDFHNHNGTNSELVLFKNLHGFIQTVTTAPSGTPRRIGEQIKIYIDDLGTPTVKRLYIYSFEAQLWSYVALT